MQDWHVRQKHQHENGIQDRGRQRQRIEEVVAEQSLVDESESLSRQQWAVVVANVLRKSWDDDLVRDVVAGGQAKFLRVAKKFLAGKGLQRSDYIAIYTMLSMSSGQQPK